MVPFPRTSLRLVSVAARAAVLGAALAAGVAQAQTVVSSSGAAATDITTAVNDYRALLGALNPNVAGSFAAGRREINWDGVPDAFSAPNPFPADFFNQNTPGRARGAVFGTPGSSLQVSASATNPTLTLVEFGNINPTYPGFFAPFSPQKLFTAIGSNVVDVTFFVPGSTQAALTRGFGAIFSDVDLADTTSISFFDATNTLLDTFFAPSFDGSETFSFLGVDYGSAVVSRVRIINGSEALGPATTGDVVAMDDFIYGEPLVAIPEPEVHALLLAGLGVLAAVARRRAGRRSPAQA
jgi:hypothetical protein